MSIQTLKPLALAIAMAALPGFHGAAQADLWIDRCTASYYGQGSDTYCHQSYQEGLAAVLTGTGTNDTGAWGYLDKQGRMAITPAYTDVTPFQNGLAAVAQGERWGYIDTKGNWVIPPRFASATSFNAEGTALAEEDDHDVLIDRQGKVVKVFELGTRTWGFQPGQKLAAMETPAPPSLFNTATGKAVALPAGVMALAAPTGGYLPAQLRESRYSGWWGLLDTARGGWAIAPDVLRSRDAPKRDGDVLAVLRDREWEFVNPRGEPISATRYEQIDWVAPGVWLVKPAGGKTALLDGQFNTLHQFSAQYVNVQEQGGWRFIADTAMAMLINAEGDIAWLPLREGRLEINRGLAWVYGVPARSAGSASGMAMDAAADATTATDGASDAVKEMSATEAQAGDAAVAADTAIAVDAAADTAMATDAAVADAAADTAMTTEVTVAAVATPATGVDEDDQAAEIPVSGNESLYQIYAPDGSGLLDTATVARLREYQLNAFTVSKTALRGKDAKDVPLILLRPNDYEQPLAILTAAGKIVSNADWSNIDSYEVTMPLVVYNHDSKAGAIDGQGNWIIAPQYTNMRAFAGAYAWALSDDTQEGKSQLVDAQGKAVTPPADVSASSSKLDGDLLIYRAPDDNRERLWGIWNIRKRVAVLKPAYERIEEFEDDWARVEDKGRWGAVNREGKWVIPATHDSAYKMEYLGDGFMLVDDAAAEDKASRYGESAYRLVNLRTGKSSDTLYGKPDKLKDGRFVGQLADASAVLFDAQGGVTRISEGRPESKEQYQDWIYVRNGEREGAIDARGNMKVPAIYGEFNPFFAQPEGLARVNLGSGYRVIDQNGKTVLEKMGDGSPLASMQRIVFSDSRSANSIMTDLQGREITRVAGQYSVEDRNASEGVVPYSVQGGKSGFLDASGKRVVGPHFDQLGPLKNGLAKARRLDRTGKLYGYIDLSGRYAIAPDFIWAESFNDERAMVRRGSQIQFIDTKGQVSTSFGVVCNTVVILDPQGKQTWPRQKLTCPEAAELQLAALDNAKAE